jgi:hypothetical protein
VLQLLLREVYAGHRHHDIGFLDVGGDYLYVGTGSAGRSVLWWDGRDNAHHAVASGVYIVRLATPSGETRGRVTWMR